tara:strand:- start:3984 stop:5888 length:1905 start_codon:yes stop_codon:yes gene_type:complete
MPTQAQLFGDHGSRCATAISNNYDTCGSITRSNIAYTTPDGLLSIFKSSGEYRDMQALMTTNMELKACGTKTYGLYDWLMSSARPVGSLINQKKIQGTDSIMEPFILASQKSIINDDYWALTDSFDPGSSSGEYQALNASAANYPLTDAQVTATTYGTVTRVLRLVSRYGLDGTSGSQGAWFVPGATVHVFSRKASGAAARTQYIVSAAAAKADGSYTDVAVVKIANGDSTSDGTEKSGVAVIGVNNVSDYESWCNNRPALNPNRVVPFWTQTSRYTLCVDEFYKEWFAKLTANNPYFAKFGDVTLAERNRQLGAMWQKEWMNSFFWGKRISTNQSLANWTSLDPQYAHYDANLGGVTTGATSHIVSRKANAIGVYEQLHACGRVKDLKGQRLNLAELFNELYNLYRTRSNSGRPADSIDCYTDSKTASVIQTAMVKYYGAATLDKASGNSVMRFDYQVKDGKIDKLGFRVRSYELLYPQGVTLNIITDHFFDDLVSATIKEQNDGNAEGNASASGRFVADTGRFLMLLDLGGGVYPGIVDSNRKVHTVGALEDLAKIDSGYGCVMRSPTKEVTLNSVTWTAVVECPDDNLIIENFDASEPDIVENTSAYTVLGDSAGSSTSTDILSDDDTAND